MEKILLDHFRRGKDRDIQEQSPYSFFVYDTVQVISWSHNRFVPTHASVADTFKLKLLKAGNGDYLAKKWKINDSEFLVATIPLYRKYNITNSYLNTRWNERIFPSGNITILEPNASLGIPVCAQSQCPFRISFLPDDSPVHENIQFMTVMFFSIFIILLILIMERLVKRIPYPEVGFLALYGFLYGLRFLMITFNFPNTLYPSDLFNPQVFASSPLNASLGDLILNELALLFWCFHLFKNYHRFKIFQFLYQRNWISKLLSVVAGLCILFSILFPFVVIQTIYNNSAITLDISQSLDFDGLRIIAIVAVLLSGVCSFLFAHTFIRLLIADGSKSEGDLVLFCGNGFICRHQYIDGTALFIFSRPRKLLFFSGLLFKIILRTKAPYVCNVFLSVCCHFFSVCKWGLCNPVL